MNQNKSKFLSLFMFSVFFMVIFTGCIHKISSSGVTISISKEDLNQSLKKHFPYERDFIVGKLEANNPKVTIDSKQNRLFYSLHLNFLVLDLKIVDGTFNLSGKPYFKKDKKQLFLKDLKIEKLDFTGLNGKTDLPKSFVDSMNAMINEFFKDYPIYEIEKNSFNDYFVKDIKIEDSQVLITYGI